MFRKKFLKYWCFDFHKLSSGTFLKTSIISEIQSDRPSATDWVDIDVSLWYNIITKIRR